jgi:hypothetical protein
MIALDNGAVCLDNDSSHFGLYQQDNQEMAMYYIVESNKSFEQAAIDLEAAVGCDAGQRGASSRSHMTRSMHPDRRRANTFIILE